MKKYFFELYPVLGWRLSDAMLPKEWFYAPDDVYFETLEDCRMAAIKQATRFYANRFKDFRGALRDVSIELFAKCRNKVIKNEENLKLSNCK